MVDIGSFEDELPGIKRGCEHGSFNYQNPNISFSDTVTSHFRTIQRNDKHGIYIIRQKSTGEVLYIGKGGSLDRYGNFKSQDIPGRLKNVKNRDIPANEWFNSLFEEKGQLLIEYVFLPTTPIAPTFVESLLLQAYYNEYKSLPRCNNSF
jgi:hypothetical protein